MPGLVRVGTVSAGHYWLFSTWVDHARVVIAKSISVSIIIAWKTFDEF